MPGPAPTVCPVFPEGFLRQARGEVRRKTASPLSVQRYQLARLLHEEPHVGHVEAGQRVGLSGCQVRRWRKRWATGDFSVADASGRGRKAFFPPLDHALVKAVACALVVETKQPLSRQSLADVTARAQKALGKPIRRSTVWRIVPTDAIKPWRYKYWIFPRAPQCAAKAGPILDLYAGTWQGQPLGPTDYLLSADEKTSIQARRRGHPARPPAPGHPARVENAYERGGALPYLAAGDVRRGDVMGRCEATTGIEPLGRLVNPVLAAEPYASAERLFWIVDNGSSPRGATAKQRLHPVDGRIMVVQTPVHASWLNQVEIYFSSIQRKVLTPNDFADLEVIRLRLALYEALSNQSPHPFQWKFDRTTLTTVLAKIKAHQMRIADAQRNGLEEAA